MVSFGCCRPNGPYISGDGVVRTDAPPVGRVVLTHLAPGMDEERDTSGYTTGISAHFRGPVTVANDLDRF